MSAIIDVKQRDEELYRAYKHAFQQPGMTHRKAVHLAIHTQTSRYWVSTIYVYRDILSRLEDIPHPTTPKDAASTTTRAVNTCTTNSSTSIANSPSNATSVDALPTSSSRSSSTDLPPVSTSTTAKHRKS